MKAQRPKQLVLLPRKKEGTQHGGDIRKGKRKLARPFHPKLPMHLVVRASRAHGVFSMLHPRHERRISDLVRTTARNNTVHIIRFVNVGNHLHLLLQAATQDGFKRFLRALTGRIAALVTGAVRGQPQGKFWDKLAYSRLVSWGQEFRTVEKYLIENLFEAAGVWDRKKDPRRKVHHFSSA